MRASLSDRALILRAFGATLWRSRKAQSRAGFEAWQQQALEHWLVHDLPRVPFYRDAAARLADLPVITKSDVMADFHAFNAQGITAAQGWEAYEGSGQINDINIGASTGTSGQRSLYAITRQERFWWLGTILAKALPGFLWRREKVAVVLPQASVLYDGANAAGPLSLRFFDLMSGPEVWGPALSAFGPTTLVAPPRVLRLLAENGPSITPRTLFSGGETLDPVDRAVIEAGFARPLGQIYMASEGLLGVSCAHGTLHLAEDANHFELEPFGEGLVSPLITSFRRRFQIMARYRMNDLLRLAPTPCPCGSPLRAVAEIVGRSDDAFEMPGRAGAKVLVTPDVLRNCVLGASRAIADFRLTRRGPSWLEITLPPTGPADLDKSVIQAVNTCLAGFGVTAQITVLRANMPFDATQKLRRIRDLCSEESRIP